MPRGAMPSSATSSIGPIHPTPCTRRSTRSTASCRSCARRCGAPRPTGAWSSRSGSRGWRSPASTATRSRTCSPRHRAMAQLGVVFPQAELGSDPDAARAFAQAVEALGYRHLQVYDHVLGADPAFRPGWTGFDSGDPFHEVLVLFGFLAAVTATLE